MLQRAIIVRLLTNLGKPDPFQFVWETGAGKSVAHPFPVLEVEA